MKVNKKVIVELSNDELFDEIMKRKKERQAKKSTSTKKVKADKKVSEDKDNLEQKSTVKDISKSDNEVKEENKSFNQKSKVLPPSYISEITETIDISEIIKLQEKENRKKGNIFIWIFILVILVVIAFVFYKFYFKQPNFVDVKNIIINSYDKENDVIDISVLPSSKQDYCAIVSDIVEDSKEINFQKIDNGSCDKKVNRKSYYIYFKNDKGVVSEALELNNYVVSMELDDNYYIPMNKSVDLREGLVTVGDVDIDWYSSKEKQDYKDDEFVSNEVSNTNLYGMVEDKKIVSTNIYVTDVITEMPKEFDTKKKYVSCNQFSKEEAELLDEILESRINDVGYGTRAGVVAAARFLTLEFPYRINYYYESGRVSNTGVNFSDGEGRYYHKGLYLDESKYEDIQKSFYGKAMWGCNLMSYEDDPPYFIPGRKYPNGLDCSGFVSWVLLNGGFDVGDYGAGPLDGTKDLTDFGTLKRLNQTLINSGEIKVGDLFSVSGHISILVGKDNDNYYIAESLQTYGGLVVKKYSKKKVTNNFSHVVLMDELYKEDGNLTKMWY